MDQASILQSGFNIKEYIADTLSDQNLAARGELLLQGAEDVRRISGTVVEWYQSLGPGQFTIWYRALKPDELTQWFYVLLEWSKTPQAVTLGMTWLITYFLVYVFIARKLGFGVRGVTAGTIAAAWQSYAYGAFTPAGSVFAFLLSIGMMGKTQAVAASTGAVIATVVTACVCIFAGGA